MKNDKNKKPEKKGIADQKKPNSQAQGMRPANTSAASATENVKPRSGRGLMNEGTNVSYDAER